MPTNRPALVLAATALAAGTLTACGSTEPATTTTTASEDSAAIEARIAREREDAANQARQADRVKALEAKVKRLEKRKSSTTVIEKSSPGAPATSPGPSASVAGTWPSGTSGWTVVLDSVDSQATAENIAARARSAGLANVGVLYSSDHSSLRPGYWVAYSGQTDKPGAEQIARDARNAGFSGAYARYVSSG